MKPRLKCSLSRSALNRDDLLEAVPVAGNGEGYGVVLILLAQRAGRHDQHFVRYGGFGNVQFASFHHDAVFQAFLDVNVGAGEWLSRA